MRMKDNGALSHLRANEKVVDIVLIVAGEAKVPSQPLFFPLGALVRQKDLASEREDLGASRKLGQHRWLSSWDAHNVMC